MATLMLKQFWLNLADTGEGLTAPTSGRSFSDGVDGEVQTYASGRRRFIGKEGEVGQWTVTLLLLTLAQVETLDLWAGFTVLARDHRGVGKWGVYDSVARAEFKSPVLYSATITIRFVTHDDGV